MIETPLLTQVQAFAEGILQQLPPHYSYHNYQHTSDVVATTFAIASTMNIEAKALETLLIAAWLHDIGYSQSATDHEQIGADMAREFLTTLDVSEKRINKICTYILATRMPQMPMNAKEMILCDADLAHLADEAFWEKSESLRQEISYTKEPLSEKEWLKTTLAFFEEHRYFTPYGKSILAPKKELNKLQMEEKLSLLKESKKLKKVENDKQTKEEKIKKPERGVETMFRTTSANHFQLSAMADNKANIMISVNTIIISLIVSILVRKLEENTYLVVPTIMLTVVCLFATVFAVLATIPNVTKGKFSKEDIDNRTANLLFFGNFHQMTLEDYQAGMKEMMNDSEFLYASMTRDIYFLGKVLGRKYKLLRIAYGIFMFGFVASVIAFGVAALLENL